MHVIKERNVNYAFSQGIRLLDTFGLLEDSRNGGVLVMPHPVMTIITNPMERVLFGEERDANPFFHLMEAMWMLAYHNDVAFPAHFNGRFIEYSDNGKTLHAAYGHRWGHHFDMDQVWQSIEMLKRDPKTRRVVISMWDPAVDLGGQGKDLPCNTHIYLWVCPITQRLNMTTSNRSNDIVWGLYGANIVHLTFLQEFIALAADIPMGEYYHLSNNFHAYPGAVDLTSLQRMQVSTWYSSGHKHHQGNAPYEQLFSRASVAKDWQHNIRAFVQDLGATGPYDHPFIDQTLVPMMHVWNSRADREHAYKLTQTVMAGDWAEAARQWILRRVLRDQEKENA